MSTNEREGFVYLIQEEDTDNYKIGHTNNMERRWKQINSPKPPRPYALVWKIYCSDRYEAESALHRQFADFRGNGEWFNFSEDMISGAVSDAYDYWNEEETSDDYWNEEEVDQTSEDPVYSGSSYSGGYSSGGDFPWGGLIGSAFCALSLFAFLGAGRSTNYVFCKSEPGCNAIYVRNADGNKILTIGNRTPVNVIGKPDETGYVKASVTTSKGQSVIGYVDPINLTNQPPSEWR
jgi:T5orf172 domain